MNKALVALVAAALLSQAQAAPPRPPAVSNSADFPTRSHRPLHLPNMPDAALAPTNEDVGDGDSFGRSVNYLGWAATDGVAVATDCEGNPPERCVVRDPAGGNSIVFTGDEAVIKLPARASHSLLCFTVTPLAFASFWNPTDTPQVATVTLGATWHIESEVLNDPALIDPVTGAPFNGSMTGNATYYLEGRSIAPHDGGFVSPYASRNCISGHVSRRSLVGMGLSDAQARDFFRKPITLRFGSRAYGYLADAVSQYGVRVYGD